MMGNAPSEAAFSWLSLPLGFVILDKAYAFSPCHFPHLQGETQCLLSALVKLTGAPGPSPVTTSLCSSPQLGVSQEGDGCPLRVAPPPLLSTAEFSKCRLVLLILFNPGRPIRKLWNRFENKKMLLDSFELTEVSFSPDSGGSRL